MRDEALKLALEALEGQQPENPFSVESKAITAIKQALAAPVQEPVAWINAEKRTFEWNGPVLWNTPTVAVLDKIPLYTTPPAAQRQWVGLTDEEAKKAFAEHNCDISKDLAGILARAIKAKLKEKNT